MSIGSDHLEQRDFSRALEYMQRALATYEAAGAGEMPDAAGFLMSIGSVDLKQGDLQGPREHFQRALAKYEAAGAGETSDAVDCRRFLRR